MSFYSRYIFPRFLDWTMNRPHFRNKRKEVLAQAQGDILEIGFGTGLNASAYPPHIKKITTVDVNPGMSLLAQKRIAQSGLTVENHVITAERLPFADNTFDTVVSTWTLCSIPDVDAAMREVHRVLKPDGRFVFIEHGLHPNVRVQKWQRRITPLWKEIGDGCHLDRNIKEIILRQGFVMDKYKEEHAPGAPVLVAHMYQGVAKK